MRACTAVRTEQDKRTMPPIVRTLSRSAAPKRSSGIAHRDSGYGQAGLAHIGWLWTLVSTLYDGHARGSGTIAITTIIDADVHKNCYPETVGTARPKYGPHDAEWDELHG